MQGEASQPFVSSQGAAQKFEEISIQYRTVPVQLLFVTCTTVVRRMRIKILSTKNRLENDFYSQLQCKRTQVRTALTYLACSDKVKLVCS